MNSEFFCRALNDKRHINASNKNNSNSGLIDDKLNEHLN
jgi:hypothetical protein